MSEYAHDEESSPPQCDVNLQNNLEDSVNNSIIGKVKSKVSSILPNSLSKWFSPSSKIQNDSLNGSICSGNNTLQTRRRRRIDLEEEENYEEDNDVQHCAGYGDNNHAYLKQMHNQESDIVVDDNDNEDDSQNSEEEHNSNSKNQTMRDLNVESQPPAKRSRLNIESNISPGDTRHRPLLSSTPAVGNAYSRNTALSSSVTRSNCQKFNHLNLYGNQCGKEPAFNFGQQKESKSKNKISDITEMITNSSYDHNNKYIEASNVYSSSRTGISSRKSLNIPSTSTVAGFERAYGTVANLKRQPLSSAKTHLAEMNLIEEPIRCSSTTLQEVEDQLVEDSYNKNYDSIEKRDHTASETNSNSYNGSVDGPNNFNNNKRQRIINGTSLNAAYVPGSNKQILEDSASESGDSAMDVHKSNTPNTQQRKTGLFNMSASGTANIPNSSRTSSFGNGLNFYTHLEGRKSLFGGPHHGNLGALNNSTLSLTSLNRRQFNASLYGSTSALSDSRLLNTFSPFYKGKTTYGGAAAYNKYTGASSVRITPTLIRPISSISTLSSNNSLVNNANTQAGENSAISSTAKRILDLINDFATPLSEAKKMANNIKTNLQMSSQTKGRLNENDLIASRAMRLSQVRTPYSRPAVTLHQSGNASGHFAAGGILPPVKELQVPTMSQLLQMKKIQNTTENARKITQNSTANSEISEYTLPDTKSIKATQQIGLVQDQSKHTNKIKNKMSNIIRASSASKDLQYEEPPPPVNLPNIAFPLMQSVPKIDIKLNTTHDKVNHENRNLKPLPTVEDSYDPKLGSSKSTSITLNTLPTTSVAIIDKIVELPTSCSNSSSKSSPIYRFSEPLQVVGALPSVQGVGKKVVDKFVFSHPIDVMNPSASSDSFNVFNTQNKALQLKEGSCLEALSKPFVLPAGSKQKVAEQTFSNNALSFSSSFGDQYKKSSNEWECDACMVRNKSDLSKCVACETPRKGDTATSYPALNTSIPATSFGQQFKKPQNEWECSTCMIRNKESIEKCVACETPRKCVDQQITAPTPIKNSFGDAFKLKPDFWECPTCMISNKNEINECIACHTKKPGVATTIPSATSKCTGPVHKFGFGVTENTNCKTDEGFQKLAAQQNASKWECDACMTRNDANRTKCACCEQPKPGTTSMESINATSNKFQFGATAAAKFSFGFGNGNNAPKEEDLRKEISSKSQESEKQTPSNLGSCTRQGVPSLGDFQFGFKSKTTNTSDCQKNEVDSNKQSISLKFGASTPADKSKMGDSTTVVPSPTNFVFGSKPLTATQTTSSPTLSSIAATVSSTSVKFSMPATTNSNNDNDKSKAVAQPTFSFGVTVPSSTTGGFCFGPKSNTKSTIEAVEEKKASDDIDFKAPATSKASASIFGSSAIKSSSKTVPVSFISSTFEDSAPKATTTFTTATVKPMLGFGTNTSTTSTLNSQATPAFSSFSFGSNPTSHASAATTVANKLFSSVISTSITSSTTNATQNTLAVSTSSISSTTTTTPASTNIFGSLCGGAVSSNPSPTPIFGSSVNPPANNNLSTVSSSTNNPTLSNSLHLGTFGSKTSNVFGSFGGPSSVETKNSSLVKSNETKPTLPVFGNVASSSTSQSSQSSSSVFSFNSNTVNDARVMTTTATISSVTSTSTTWPKNSFLFGSASAAMSSTNNTTVPVSESENKEAPKPSVFGTFGSSNLNSQQQTSSIFGVPATNIGAPLPSVGPTNTSTNLFGSNLTSPATNIFGSNSSGNAATPTPAFGSSPFGGAASSTSATPTFGSTAASGTAFGRFGGTSSNISGNATEVKKPEAAFNFGTAATAQSTSSGFNFGSSSSATKPAFNFGGTSATQHHTFNFTGKTELQNSTKPFQFGATPSAPVFNFNRGVLEGTSNAPFQFNAGAAPVSSNIFAPTPTPGSQTAQQAKRKIRAPIRRLTQR